MVSNANSIIVQQFQNNAPYFDGGQYEIEQGYVQLLFQPARALQARELTTLQSLLQFQLSQAGNFLFENGSPVQGGHITFDNSVLSIQLQANDSINLSDFDDVLLVNQVGAVNTQAVVIVTDSTVASNTVEGALVVKYLSGNEFPDGGQIQIATGNQEVAFLVPANATSAASIASINEGVFYVDGYFVFVKQQTICLSSTTAFPTARVGLQIQPGIVTSSQDSTLLDPAQGSFNFQAPGADRFQFDLVLSQRSLDSTDDSLFIELIRIENGVITSQIEYPVLGSIQDELASRTFDTNGNFVVSPFIATALDDPSNSNNTLVSINPGRAYVDGYEFDTISSVKMSTPKARTTNSSTDYVLSLEFGNYVAVTNVFSGNASGFNTGNFGTMDVHLVQSSNVNTTNLQAYSNTMIGTAKIRDIEYNGPNNWLAYILDVNLVPIVVNAAGVSANTTSITLPGTFTSSINAINNVAVTVLTGNSSGDTRTIVSYNSASRVAYLDRPTTQLIDTTSVLSIAFGVKDINGLVETPAIGGNVFYTQNSTAGKYACMDIAINGGKDTVGNTILFSTNFDHMDYPLPQTYLAQNTMSNVTFVNRKTIANVSFVSGNAVIGTGSGLDSNEIYTFGLLNQFLADQTAAENFFVVVRSTQTSNLANGIPLVWDHGTNPAGNGVFQTDSTHVTIKTVTTGNFLADILLTVEDQNASVNFRRQKTYIGNTSNTTLRSTDSYLNGQVVIGSTNNSVFIDSANGIVWYTSYPDIQKTPGIRMSMGLPDVIQIIKVYDSGNPNFMPNATNAIDITSHYIFDSGQRDNYYDHAGLILGPGQQPPTGQTAVMLVYYQHSSTSGFFSVDSYSAYNYAYNQIPIYSSAQFNSVNLRDVIDFRPTRTPGYTSNIQQFTLTGLRLPQPDNPMTLSYQYYLPRVDKLVLTKNRQFTILQGVPALQPVAPVDQPNSMTLYTLSIPQYTFSAANIAMSYVENKRYTMADIGSLDLRIQQLEYYASLSQLESQGISKTVNYQDGTAKQQYGIITDAFMDYSVADTINPDLLCSIANGQLGPHQPITPISFVFSSNTGPAVLNERTMSLDYTETPIIVQNTASDFTQIQPYAFGQFQGQVQLYPQTDSWYSDDILPTISGPPPDVPPITPTPPAPSPLPPPPAPVGLNTANLVPPTVTTVPPAPVPPPAGPYAAAVAGKVTYCYPLQDWSAQYNSVFSLGYAMTHGYPLGFAGVLYYGTPCVIIEKTASGWMVMDPNGSWYPVAPRIGPNASALVAQGLLTQYNPNAGSATVLAETQSAFAVGP